MPITELLERNAREYTNDTALVELNPAITEVELVALHEDQMDRVDLFIDLDRSRMKSELDTKLPRWTTKDTEEEGVTYDRVFDNLEELALALNEVTEA